MENLTKKTPLLTKLILILLGIFVTSLIFATTIKFLQEKFEDIRQSEVMKNKICGGCAKRSEVDLLTKKIMKMIRKTIVRVG